MVTALSLVGFVLLVLWMNQRREFLVFQRSLILLNNQSNARQRDRQILDELDRQRDRRNARVLVSMRDSSKSISMVITVIGLVILIATTILSIIFFEEGAFYRGYFLVFPAILFGAELAFFGTTPKYWIWVSFGFSLFSLASTVWGSILEVPRFFDCVLSGSSPVGAIDTNICNNDHWRGYILPWVLVLIGILSLLQAFLLIQMGNRTSIFKSRRAA